MVFLRLLSSPVLDEIQSHHFTKMKITAHFQHQVFSESQRTLSSEISGETAEIWPKI
jgi:hypothetical protein